MTAITLTIIGAAIIVGAFLEIAVLIYFETIKPLTLVTLGLLAIFAGATTANLTDITKIVASFGSGNAIEIQRNIETKADQVKVDTQEVRNLKDQVNALVVRAETSEKNVAQMQSVVRQMSREILALFILIINSTTHEMSPKAFAELLKQINNLLILAYPNKGEKDREMARIFDLMHQPTPTATGSPTP